MASLFNATDLIGVISRWRKHLFVILLLSIVVPAIFSGPAFIKPKYKSNVILYLSNIIPYGNETPTEQSLQLLQSGDIREQIIKKFDLMKHYGINPEKTKYPMTELNEEFDENISFRKTEFESVEIQVYDTDPKIAADIANTFVDLFNLKARQLQRDKSAEVVKITKTEMEKKKAEMDSLEALLFKMPQPIANGPVTLEKQSQLVMKDQYSMLASENLWKTRSTYNDLKILYETAVRDVVKELTYSNIVSKAYPAEKKSYPIRWLIIVLSMMSAFLLSLITLVSIENYKKLKA